MAEKYLTYTGLQTYDGLIKNWTETRFGGTIKGYYDDGEFYEHAIHSSEDSLTPKENYLYVDLGDNNRLYMYNGSSYEPVSDSGSAEISLNEATISCGGISKGTDLTGLSLQEILEMMISPYVPPTSLSVVPYKSKISYIEQGDTDIYINSVKVSWTNGSIPVDRVALSGDASMVIDNISPSVNSVTFELETPIQITTSSKSFTASLNVPGKNPVSASGSISNNYVYPIYYGAVSVTADNLAASDIQGATKVLSSGTQTYAYTVSDGYPMIASKNRITKVTDASGITDYTNAFKSSETEISLSSVNPAWGPTTYYVYTGSRATLNAFQFKFTF